MVGSERDGQMEGTDDDLLRRPARKFYSIREVSELLEVKAHVLRYWETQFPFLRPRKHRGGARMYQDRDLDLLRSIKEMLYDRGYTIAGARQRLGEERRVVRETPRPQIEMDFRSPADHRGLREVRDGLAELLSLLREKPGAPGRRLGRRLRGAGEGAVADRDVADGDDAKGDTGEPDADISVEPGEAAR